MPNSTKNFGIGFFDFGDQFGIDFSGQIEIDRFVFLDRMLFGLMSIFGDGVVEGWVVSAPTSFEISITEGFGNINFIAAKTNFPVTVKDIPVNTTVYVYGKSLVDTASTQQIEFVIDTSATLGETNPNMLLLSKVVSNSVAIQTVDNTVRQEIRFIELIKAAIRQHKHRGGSLNPAKINLATEVKGQLPSFRVANMDADKITSGIFDLSQIPLLDHQELKNVGLLTHPQLDTFVKTLEASNTELFGEIGSSNLLQLIIAAKLIYEDPDSVFFTGSKIDENMINEFAIIPGITDNDKIDFTNSTATIDLEQHFVEGIPPKTGTSFFVNFDSAAAWDSAFLLENLIISGTSVALSFDSDQQTTTTVVEGFDSVNPGENLSSGDNNLFTEKTVTLVDNAQITSEFNANNVVDGFFSGKFTHEQSFRSQFVKTFVEPQDWTTFDTFTLDIKSLGGENQTHGTVNMFFTAENGDISPDFLLLAQNEVTDNFEMRIVDLTTIPFRNTIKSFTIYTDDHTNVFSYFIDKIQIQKLLLLPEEGTLKLRYSTANTITFSTLSWNSDEPAGTGLAVRARAANGTVLLNRASYTGLLNAGDTLNLEGTDLELEITFTPDADRLKSPILNSVRLLVLAEAEIDGFAIDSASEFIRGDQSNSKVSGASVVLKTPIFVDSFYFALHDGVHQIHEEIASDGGTFVDSDADGAQIFGTKDTPISPNLVFEKVEELGVSATVTSSRLFEPKSVKRQTDRSLTVADTYNDRVLSLEEDGSLLSGVGSINYEADTLFPIAASVDVRTGILYLVWSKKVSFKSVNVSKIILQSSDQSVASVQMIKDFDKILGFTTDELQNVNAEGQIMPVFLSAQNAGLAQLMPAKETFLQADPGVEDGVIPGGINANSVFYKAATGGSTLGIHCFVGNFAYIDGIFSPTWADARLSGGFVIANASVAVTDYVFPEGVTESITKTTNISSILEVDENNNAVFGSDVMQFSPFIPGRVQELDKSTLLIGGIKPGGEDGTLENPLNFRSLSGDSDSKDQQKQVLNQLLFGSANPYVGSVIIYDKNVNSTIFQYTSPEGLLVSDVDVDNAGQYVVAESSLNRSGRVIKIDTVGNVVFTTAQGVYSLINDIFVQFDDSIVIST